MSEVEGLGEDRVSYQVAGITFLIGSDLPITRQTFLPELEPFRSDGTGEDQVCIRHHFGLPDPSALPPGKLVYHRPPWAISDTGDGWLYLGITPEEGDPHLYHVIVFNRDHTQGDFYHPTDIQFKNGGLPSLTLLNADQILLARLLAVRQAFYLHASGLSIGGQGLAFVGHSGAGKSTIAGLLAEMGEVLSDDRVIVRCWPDGFRLHGAWTQGSNKQFTPGCVPLRAVLLLEQAPENRLVRLQPHEAVRELPQFVVRPLVTRDWWEAVLDVIGSLAREVPVYRLRFDKSGQVRRLLQELL